MQQEEEQQYLRPEWVLDNFGLADEDVLNIYLYGSRVYGTHSAESDWDYIVLLRREVGLLLPKHEEEAQQHGKAEEQEAGNKDASGQQQVSSLKELEAACDGKLTIQGKDNVSDATLITLSNFQRLLDAHYPPILECYYLPSNMILLQRHPHSQFHFHLRPSALRNTFAAKCDHSWTKAMKKMTIAKDKNVYIAKKSLFHSFRMLHYAIDLCQEGELSHFQTEELRQLWAEIRGCESEEWSFYQQRYRPRWNALRSKLRALAPKNSS